MRVGELIAKLQAEDPEAEVHFCAQHSGGTTEVDTMFPDTTTYGLFLPPERQRHVPIVVLDTGMCGL